MKLAARKALGMPSSEQAQHEQCQAGQFCAAQCGMSTALRVGGVAALALVPVAVVLTVWLLRQ